MSSRTNKYRRIIETKKKEGKHCDILHIVKLDDSRESVFLIQDMFPVSEEYIEREYTIAGNHLVLTSEHTVKEIEQKARKVMGMLKHGIKFTPTQPNVMALVEPKNKTIYLDFYSFYNIIEQKCPRVSEEYRSVFNSVLHEYILC